MKRKDDGNQLGSNTGLVIGALVLIAFGIIFLIYTGKDGALVGFLSVIVGVLAGLLSQTGKRF